MRASMTTPDRLYVAAHRGNSKKCRMHADCPDRCITIGC